MACSIVFSTWRMTLRGVELALEEVGKSSVRFDGSVSHKERQLAVQKFKNDPGISVMLLTLSCGAVGCELQNALPLFRRNANACPQTYADSSNPCLSHGASLVGLQLYRGLPI